MVFKKSYQRGCFDRRLANHLEMPRKKKRHKRYRSKVKKKHAEAYQATSQDCKDADITIWTDGSCVASQFGPGAWSFILRSDEKEIEASGYDSHTTVNRMEMMAAVEGLKRCPEGVAVLVISDSMLLVKCGSGEWKRKANLDLWSLLDEQMQNRSVVFRWVRSHNGDEMNERCDTLCGQARRSKLGGIAEKTLEKKEVAPVVDPVKEQRIVLSSETSSWARRLRDGRTMVISIIEGSPMPKGVNDAVIHTRLAFGRMRDETAAGSGRTWVDIIEDGWKANHQKNDAITEAMNLLD